MKKITIFFLFLATCCLQANAQFEKGTFLTGGSVSFSWQASSNNQPSSAPNSNPPNPKQWSASETPTVGYFIANNFALGAGISASQSHESNAAYSIDANGNIINVTSLSTHGISFTPFARYYIQKAFFQANYSIGFNHYAYHNSDYSSDGRSHGFNAGVGYAIFLSKNIAVEPFLGFSHLHNGSKGGDTYATINQVFLRIGFQIYLHKKS